jgi:hypothetical protein
MHVRALAAHVASMWPAARAAQPAAVCPDQGCRSRTLLPTTPAITRHTAGDIYYMKTHGFPEFLWDSMPDVLKPARLFDAGHDTSAASECGHLLGC